MNNMRKSLKASNGITLIALVITIIVLLILAGISISMLSGDNGILQKATDAKTDTEKANEKEQIQLEVLGSYETNGILKAETVKNNINNHIFNATATCTTTDSGEDFPIIVEFSNTGNKYTIENNGIIDKFTLANTTWQDNVNYVLDENAKTLTLVANDTSKTDIYNGEVVVKKTAVINEVEYTTKFPNSCEKLFANATRMTSFTMEEMDTSNITNMFLMFSGCSQLQNIDVSNLDTINVTNMGGMFGGCISLSNLDLSTFNVQKVERLWVCRNVWRFCCRKVKFIRLEIW